MQLMAAPPRSQYKEGSRHTVSVARLVDTLPAERPPKFRSKVVGCFLASFDDHSQVQQ